MAMYRKLGRSSAQRKALLRTQVTQLLYHGKIVTTEARAKEVRKIAEKVIAMAVREKDNYEEVTVKAKVPRKNADGKRVKEVIDGKRRTVYDEVDKTIKKDQPSRLHARREMLKILYPVTSSETTRKDGKVGGYSRATISKTHNVLSSIMRTAVEWEIIERNPCGKVKVPSIPKTADNIKFFTPEQTAAFLAYTEEPHTWEVKAHNRIDDTAKGYTVGQYTSQKGLSLQLQVLFHMAIYTGMRKGELLALKWPDIDFENNTVHVTKSVSVLKGRVIIKEPKTRTSHRTITIPQSLTVKLQKLRISQSEYRLSVGEYWQNEDWIFTQDNGKMMNYSTPYHALQNTIKWYNQSHPENEALPLIPFYGLRHTSATLLIAGKQDVKTVSSRLGHAQTSTTMNIYAHALQEGDQRAADTLETILKKHS